MASVDMVNFFYTVIFLTKIISIVFGLWTVKLE